MIRRVLRGALTRLRAREPRKEAPAATPPAPPPVDGGRPAAFEEEVEEAEAGGADHDQPPMESRLPIISFAVLMTCAAAR